MMCTLGKLILVIAILQAANTFAAEVLIPKSVNIRASDINLAIAEFNYDWENQDLSAAEIKAKRLVALLGSSHYQQSMNHARALHNLANVQKAMESVRSAEKNYKKSIQLIEQIHGIYTTELLLILTDLGALYYDAQEYGQATDAFTRAQHITHRTDGVYSLNQLEFLEWITLINIKSSKIKEADRQQRFSYSINVKHYGEDDARMLPVMGKLASWLRRTGQLSDALDTYEKMLLVIENQELNEIEKLQPLRGIASLAYLKASCCGEKQLVEILHIVSRNPNANHLDKLDALLHLADMFMIRKKINKATQYYRQAWIQMEGENPFDPVIFDAPELLGVNRIVDVYNAYYQTVDGRPKSSTTYYLKPQQSGSFSMSFGAKPKESTASVIGQPLSLCQSSALELARADNADDLAQYFVDINFTVSKEGRVSNVSLVDSNAPRRLQRYVTNTLRYSRYRPTLQNGEAVDTNNIKLRQTFSPTTAASNGQATFNRVSRDGKYAVSMGCEILAMRG